MGRSAVMVTVVLKMTPVSVKSAWANRLSVVDLKTDACSVLATRPVATAFRFQPNLGQLAMMETSVRLKITALRVTALAHPKTVR